MQRTDCVVTITALWFLLKILSIAGASTIYCRLESRFQPWVPQRNIWLIDWALTSQQSQLCHSRGRPLRKCLPTCQGGCAGCRPWCSCLWGRPSTPGTPSSAKKKWRSEKSFLVWFLTITDPASGQGDLVAPLAGVDEVEGVLEDQSSLADGTPDGVGGCYGRLAFLLGGQAARLDTQKMVKMSDFWDCQDLNVCTFFYDYVVCGKSKKCNIALAVYHLFCANLSRGCKLCLLTASNSSSDRYFILYRVHTHCAWLHSGRPFYSTGGADKDNR